ncbi:FAD-dependent oxidoreductase [Marivita geojedonensis]|uniref:Monooxygenase n=1 Tax=Marivita geojedonensis TaxID=1123756 RepID=A0A1X4NNZ1_9RHOB|nr:FAD-dependent oxidoreductase [Marivita geojedonensis]OSQ52183.1 monooxygenase [Marivita geojedonensis]PRY81158.1 salicylate hydroxylase [Marivita geojedonensis]
MDLGALDITVIGGGIGGLTCALALRQRGAQVTVLEQAEAITEVGAGIQVSPNGLRVIEALGLGDGLAAASVQARAVSLRNGSTGAEVARLDLTRLSSEQRYFFVHRADLVDLLSATARAQGVCIRLLQRVDTVTPNERPRIRLATGDFRDTDLAIGADGIHSAVRPVLNAAQKPFFTGQVAWRCIVPNVTGHPAHARVHMGPGRHMVTYPLRDGSVLNVVAVEERSEWAAESWSQTDDADNLRKAFAGFDAEVHQILSQAESPGVWGLFRHPVAATWHGPGLAILGDSAHPTLPFLAQGANMAMEDAWVLADSLASAPDLQTGLASYQQRRRARVTRVIDAASKNARNYHLSPGPFRFVAHTALGLLSRVSPGQMLRRFDWLYGHDVTAAAAV